jgi:uncharacterized membrane protein YozB (DUF420 family)
MGQIMIKFLNQIISSSLKLPAIIIRSRSHVNFFNRPGFLGTHAPIISDLTLILIITTAILFTIGWRLARHRHFDAHRWVQTATACLNSVVVLSVMIRSFIVHIIPGIPYKLLQGDYGVTTIHAIVGAIGLLLGIFVVFRANGLVPKPLRFKNYKRFMRMSYALYMLATLIGMVVYIEAFVVGI